MNDAEWGLPLGRGVIVLTRDANGLGALAKPAGALAHPNSNVIDKRALLLALYDRDREAYEWEASGTKHSLFLLNRLDSATSGVILVADSEELAKYVKALFEKRAISKTYVARVFGRTTPGQSVWNDRLRVEKSHGQIRVKPGEGNPTESVATVLSSSLGKPVTSLLKLEPRTGRSHQLRIQCATRKLPIIGDQTYGDFKRNREFAKATGVKRLLLHSLETTIHYEWKGTKHHFIAKAPMPAEFEIEPK